MTVGVALAGGISRRMGRDKASLPLPAALGEGDMLSWTVRRLQQVCSELVVADGGRGLLAAATSVADGPGAGPAAGILGAAAARPGRRLLVLACDLPLVPVELLRRLISLEGDWVVPHHGVSDPPAPGRLEPLCAVYGPATLEILATRVAAGRFDLHGLGEEPGLEVHFTGSGVEADGRDPGEVFLNLNRPADLEVLAALRQTPLRRGSTNQ